MRKVLFAALVAVFAASASAQTLYKLIDRNGKVTYSEKPPKEFDGQVIRIDIDPNANTATLPKPQAPAAEKGADRGSDPAPERAAAKPSQAQRVQTAKERLEAAKKAYQNAVDNPREGDVTWIGNKGGGARAVPSEDYAARLTNLEKAVKQAEEDLKRAEGG